MSIARAAAMVIAVSYAAFSVQAQTQKTPKPRAYPTPSGKAPLVIGHRDRNAARQAARI